MVQDMARLATTSPRAGGPSYLIVRKGHTDITTITARARTHSYSVQATFIFLYSLAFFFALPS